MGILLTSLWMFALGHGPSMSQAKAAFLGLLLTAVGMLALGPSPSMRPAKAAFAYDILLTFRVMPAPVRVHLPPMFWTEQGVFSV